MTLTLTLMTTMTNDYPYSQLISKRAKHPPTRNNGIAKVFTALPKGFNYDR